MVRVNLLPHREQKRQARQRQFISMAIGLAVLGVAIVGLVHIVIAARIENQNGRNALLKTEIAKLDEQIKEIDKLREQTQALLARKQIVETLQSNRTEAVHLLDQLVRQLPDGLYLKSVKQVATKVTLTGYAQSNARVSTLMRSIESSPWLTTPELIEIKSVPLDKQKVNEFTLSLQMKRAGGNAGTAAASFRPPRPRLDGCAASEGAANMTLDDIRRLNFREAGNWPLLPKVVVLGPAGRPDPGCRRVFRLEGPARRRSIAPRTRKRSSAFRIRKRRPRRSTSSSTSSSSRRSSRHSARCSSSCRTRAKWTRC